MTKHDRHVTVTRESRVSHATTTTPHHTIYLGHPSMYLTVGVAPLRVPLRAASAGDGWENQR